MELQTIDQVVDIIRGSTRVRRLAVAAAADEHTLGAVVKAKKEGLVLPQLFGAAGEIEGILNKMGEPISDYQIFDAATNAEAAALAVASAHRGETDLLMKGMLQTGEMMRAVIDKENGLLMEGDTISLFTICEMNYYHKLLVMTDSGIVRNPTLAQKAGIVKNAVNVLRAYGYETPKVAAICAVETVDPKMPETVDAQKLAEMSQTGELANCIVEGPLALDIAIHERAAKHKGVDSKIAGQVDVLLWPNVLAGNIGIKGIGCFGGMKKSVAFAVGAKVPLVITSRGTDVDNKYLAILGAAASN